MSYNGCRLTTTLSVFNVNPASNWMEIETSGADRKEIRPVGAAGISDIAGAFLTGLCLPAEARALALSAPQRALILGPAEEAHFQKLRCDKRRLDWLAGRAAAKRALRRYFRAVSGHEPDWRELEISADAQGAPRCAVADAPFFYISHCAAGGLCAVGLGGRRIGTDWEMVAARSRELARFFAGPDELPPGQDDPRSQTSLWALKEAVLKLLGLGLAASPRDVATRPELHFIGRARARWIELGRPRISQVSAHDDDAVAVVVHTQ